MSISKFTLHRRIPFSVPQSPLLALRLDSIHIQEHIEENFQQVLRGYCLSVQLLTTLSFCSTHQYNREQGNRKVLVYHSRQCAKNNMDQAHCNFIFSAGRLASYKEKSSPQQSQWKNAARQAATLVWREKNAKGATQHGKSAWF